MPSPPDRSPPAAIPDYALIRKIGQGGYGEVWLARGITGVLRAVKIVHRDRFADAAPFEREFRGVKESMASSTETGQFALLHAGQNEPAGFFYYVMELADDAECGRDIDPARYVPLTLKELRARRGRRPAAECVAHGVALSRALAALHARGLLHRDIKPSNAILVNGVAKLADIGLVASAADAHTFVGTEGFVPPEGPGTPSADVFALGKVLYELATGLDRDDFPQMPADFGAPAERKAFFALNQILLRACDPVPARRYREASALLADLEALQAGRAVRTAHRPRSFPLLLAAAAVAALATFVVVRQPWRSETTSPPAPARPPSAARQLVAKAWETLHSSPEPFRAELDAASEFCRRAAELDGTDAEVWAVWAQAEAWYVAQNIDRSDARKESARTKAARAMNLDPQSFEARLAHACTIIRSQTFNAVTPFTAEAETVLRTLLRERPEEPRTLLALGHLLYGRKEHDESVAIFDRLARQPGWDATAYSGKGWVLAAAGRRDEAMQAANRSVAARPFFGNLGLQIQLALYWYGDLDVAKAAAELLPAADLREDGGLTVALKVYHWRRESQPMLGLLNNTPRDWLRTNSFAYFGPKDYWVGVALELQGKHAAAHFAWRNALRVIETELAKNPKMNSAYVMKGRIHALLGDKVASEAAYATLRQIGGGGMSIVDQVLDGKTDRALAGLEKSSWAMLRFSPEFDLLRDDPRFQALLAAAEKDPKRSPHATKAP